MRSSPASTCASSIPRTRASATAVFRTPRASSSSTPRMHGPKKRAGAVACIEGVRTPSLVAQKVMSDTDHHLLVGRDAQRFARNLGFKIEDDLNTDRSRAAWPGVKRTDPARYLDPAKRGGVAPGRARDDGRRLADPNHFYGTINCNGINAKGEICGVTTTSGSPGRFPAVSATRRFWARDSTSTARSAPRARPAAARRTFSLASFLIVEEMRRGKSPKDAGMEALRRIKANTIEKRLQNARGEPNFNINFYMLNAKGEYAGVTMFPGPRGQRFAVCDDKARGLKSLRAVIAGRSRVKPRPTRNTRVTRQATSRVTRRWERSL